MRAPRGLCARWRRHGGRLGTPRKHRYTCLGLLATDVIKQHLGPSVFERSFRSPLPPVQSWREFAVAPGIYFPRGGILNFGLGGKGGVARSSERKNPPKQVLLNYVRQPPERRSNVVFY